MSYNNQLIFEIKSINYFVVWAKTAINKEFMLNQNTIIKNRYRIIRLLGKGGMGEVYLAEDESLGCEVAIKRVLYSKDEILVNNAEKEARVLASLQHSHLPRVFDNFTEEQNENYSQYIVMEYITGKDLCEILEDSNAPFSTTLVLEWTNILMDIIEYLHNRNPPIIHRDIKPQNIKITDQGKLFLLDFGIAKDTADQVWGDNQQPTRAPYSLNYAPLEQINGRPASVQTDIYSLCATLYHLLTNVRPPSAVDRSQNKLEGKGDSLVPAEIINPAIPRKLSQILEKGLQLNQTERFKSIQELRQNISQINISEPYHNIPKPPPKPRNKNWKLYTAITTGAIVLALGLFAVYGLWDRESRRQQEQKLLDEAQAIEQTEGQLSRNACLKYEQIKSEHLDTIKANEVIRKSNDCKSLQSLVEQLEAKEKGKDVNYQIIEEYKKIAEAYPNSAFANQAKKRIDQFETNKKATQRAWNELQEIKNLQPESAKSSAQSATDLLIRFQKVDLNNVDPMLINLIDDYKEYLNEYKVLQAEMEKKYNQINEDKMKEVEKFCNENSYDTQACINDWLNEKKDKQIEGATSMVLEQYKEQNKKLEERLNAKKEKEKTISSQLKEKYNTDFPVL